MEITKKYSFINKISGNKYNSIYKAINNITDEVVIIKIQSKDNEVNTLKNEALIYNYIQNTIGFPSLKYYGSDNKNNYMVLSYLNKSLRDIKEIYNTIPLTTILQIGIQMIDRICFFHNLKLLHRDIKPENFMIGFGNKKKVIHMIDFGFSKKYIDDNNNHIPLKKIHSIIGTPYFVSINILNNIEPSRRDDIESIIYVMLYLLLDKKNWLYINKDMNEDKKHKIILLYERMYIPKIFIDLLNYIYNLKFDETPNYVYIIELMHSFIKLDIDKDMKIIDSIN